MGITSVKFGSVRSLAKRGDKIVQPILESFERFPKMVEPSDKKGRTNWSTVWRIWHFITWFYKLNIENMEGFYWNVWFKYFLFKADEKRDYSHFYLLIFVSSYWTETHESIRQAVPVKLENLTASFPGSRLRTLPERMHTSSVVFLINMNTASGTCTSWHSDKSEKDFFF
jgi:hypothetical protein